MRMFVDIVRQSLATLWAHKLRSFLTMFGIAWGVGSLLLLVGLGEGFRSGQERNLAELGTDIIFCFTGRIPAVEGSLESGKLYHFYYDDVVAIRAQAHNVRNISAVLNREDIRAVSDYSSTNGQVFGVDVAYSQIRTVPLGNGRWINDGDDNDARRVAVIGNEMIKNMFPDRPAVGSTILLNGLRFQVIGVLAKVGREGQNGSNSRIFVPIRTMLNTFPMKGEGGENAISFINLQPLTRDLHEKAIAEVHSIIAQRHGFDPSTKDVFEDRDTVEGSRRVAKIFDAMDWFLGVVGVVTLGLGAIGVINIMLVSVAERTREIGLRKALGATQRSILIQFCIEGGFLTLLSGGIGLGVTGAFVWLLSLLPAPDGFDTPRIVPASAAVAILSLAAAGIVAGVYPARKAAMMPPVEALRSE